MVFVPFFRSEVIYGAFKVSIYSKYGLRFIQIFPLRYVLMDIFIPSRGGKETLYPILGQVFDQDGQPRSNYFKFDLRALENIDPFGLVALRNLFAWLRAGGHEVDVIPPDLSRFERTSLMHFITPDKPGPSHTSSGVSQKMIPLAHIRSIDSDRWTAAVFNRWLAERLGVSTLAVFPFTRFVKSLVRYIMGPGYASGFFVHSHISDSDNILYIVLAHYGKGIPQHIRNVWSSITNDAVGIAKATESGLRDESGRSANDLSFLIDEVVIRYNGRVSIYSAFGRTYCTPNPFGITQRLELTNAFFPGTLFDISMCLDATDLVSRINEPAVEAGFSV